MCVYTTVYYNFQIYSLDCGVTTCSKGFVSIHNWRVFANKEACENNDHPEERFGYSIIFTPLLPLLQYPLPDEWSSLLNEHR